MVKIQDTSHFCKLKDDGCERKTVNVNLPKNKNNFTSEDGKRATDDDYFPTVPIVVTAILSIILTLSIVGIVLRVLRYLCFFDHVSMLAGFSLVSEINSKLQIFPQSVKVHKATRGLLRKIRNKSREAGQPGNRRGVDRKSLLR